MNSIFISSESPNVIFIHSNVFIGMPNLQQHVKRLHEKSCNEPDINFCVSQSCNSFLVVYYDTIIPKFTFGNYERSLSELVENDPRFILAFATVVITSPISGEIYNVCTATEARRKGMMRTIFECVLADIPISYWLGVDFLNNPNSSAAIMLYLKVGFIPKGITYSSPSKSAIYNIPLLGLVHVKRSYDPITDPFNTKADPLVSHQDPVRLYSYANKMIDEYIKNFGSCSMRLFLGSNQIKKVYHKYLGSQIEHGGKLNIIPREEGFPENQVLGLEEEAEMDMDIDEDDAGIGAETYDATLSINFIETIPGSSDEFIVNVPPSYITWHTHPKVCYEKLGCYILWPSGLDMASVLYNYTLGQVGHFLFSGEGVYFLRLTKQMMGILGFLDFQSLQTLRKIVEYRMTALEEYRNKKYSGIRSSDGPGAKKYDCVIRSQYNPNCLYYDNSARNRSLIKILKIMNTTTLEKLLFVEDDDPIELEQMINQLTLSGVINSAIENFNASEYRDGPIIDSWDFPIFKVNFTYTADAEDNGVEVFLDYLIPSNASACPIPSGK